MAASDAIRQRHMEADYLNIGTTEEPEFALCGTGFTSLNENPSAQTSSKRYINSVSNRQSVNGYQWTAPFEADQIRSEEALEFIRDISDKLLVGADCETEFVQVDLDKPAEEGENTFHARQRIVAIGISSVTDNTGEMGFSGTFYGVTDPVEGTFNTQTQKFTPASAAAASILAVQQSTENSAET